MNELALFAGAGGGILGGHLLGWRTVCAVERDAFAAQVLAQRQNDGALPPFPIWSDVSSFDGKPWRELVDVVSGGFPCQDISVAGNGAGIDGARSGLWHEMARIIREVQPEVVSLENSPLLVGRGLALVLGDLTEMGYDAQWCLVSASDVGAPHKRDRDRVWLVAYAAGHRYSARGLPFRTKTPHTLSGIVSSDLAHSGGEHGKRILSSSTDTPIWSGPIERPAGSRRYGFGRWPVEPGVGRVANGVANRVDRIKALGNGQVPRVAATAFELLSMS